MLTLNTHYPYKPKKIDKIFLQECEKEKIENAVCLITQIYKENLKSIMTQLKKTDKKIKVIITGDHRPPFFKKEEQTYFPENKVLDIVLVKNEKKVNISVVCATHKVQKNRKFGFKYL